MPRKANVPEGSYSAILRKILEDNNMTQTQLSQLTGIPLRTVQNWCLAKSEPSDYVKFQLVHEITNHTLGIKTVSMVDSDLAIAVADAIGNNGSGG